MRKTDVVTATTPKTGQTWTMNILLQLIARGELKFDVGNNLLNQAPWLGSRRNLSGKGGPAMLSIEACLEQYQSIPDPRVFKMHVGYDQIPCNKLVKIITVSRDIRDIPYSFYMHFKAMRQLPGPPWPLSLFFSIPLHDFEAFFYQFFLSDMAQDMVWGVFASFWEHRNDSNVLWLRYEDMQEDLRREIKRMVDFLQWHEFATDEVIDKVIPLVDFESLKSKETSIVGNHFSKGNFFRQGKVGENRKLLTPTMEKDLMKVAYAKLPKECIEFICGGPVAY